MKWTYPLTIALALTSAASADLAAKFTDPGIDARPRAYWNWLNGDVSPAELTHDMEEAKAKGMGGLEIWDVGVLRNPDEFVPAGPPFLGPESIEAIQHVMREADRIGLELSMITSSGWNAGGTWVTPEMASKNLFVSETPVAGGDKVEVALPFPEVPENCPRGEDGMPLWWIDVAVLAWPQSTEKEIPDPSNIIDLTGQTTDGTLEWDAPPGEWQVARFVCTNNGQQLIAASPNSVGPFIDFFDPEATRFHFEHILDAIGLEKGGDPGPFKYLEVDSMELYPGIQWTPKFPKWFEQQHGYDLMPWLPVLAGWTITDAETSERFRYDYLKTVSDLLIYSHYTTGSEVCAEYGIGFAGEAGGPGPPIWNSCPVDALKALGNVTIPRGEFWIDSPRNIFLIKQIASATNIYGQKFVEAEAWTTWRRWQDGPFSLKRHVDRAFCEGLNRIVYHCFANSPESFGHPGRAYHAGIDLNPRTVWWDKSQPFMDYLSRCSQMLQEGRFVADVLHFYGDQAPNFWPMHHDVPEKPLLPGLGAGYDYDVVNSDVILNHMTVKDGRIVLDSGMSYRVLTLPEQDHMPLEVMKKLDELVGNGASILGPRPTRVPGLHDHEARTAKLRGLADAMWGAGDVGETRHGEGTVAWGITAEAWLANHGIGPDFSSDDPNAAPHLDFIHRQADDADFYFVRNTSLERIRTTCVFRVTGRAPQLWDPADGRMEPALVYQHTDGGTRVPLDLPPGGSIFVVFTGDELAAAVASLERIGGAGDPALPSPELRADADGHAATLVAWENGGYRVGEGRVEVAGLPAPLTLGGPWQVSFDPEWGGPEEIQFPQLLSWAEHPDRGVRFYSGSATYHRTLDVPGEWLAEGRRIHLDLGEVREVAEVFVNGRSAGILWKHPFHADLTEHLEPGANEVKIEVMNLWINRLAGDADQPLNEQLTRTNIPHSGTSRAREPWEALPAGLLGPVRVMLSQEIRVGLQ